MYRPVDDALGAAIRARIVGGAHRAVAVAARAGALWWLPPLLWLVVALDDALLLARAPSYAVLGMLDEPAHLATTVITVCALGAVSRWRGRRLAPGFVAAALLAGNLIDADHLPMQLGSDLLTAGTPRPYSHSVATLILLAALAVLGRRAWRHAAAGALLGAAMHLLRDLGTAPVSLLWPLDWAPYTIPHAAYLAVLGLAALTAVVLAPVAASSAGGARPR